MVDRTNEPLALREIVVAHPYGMHLRPCDLFVRRAQRFESHISVVKNGEKVDGKSIWALLALAIGPGTLLRLEATGRDADEAIEALVELIASGFDDPSASG